MNAITRLKGKALFPLLAAVVAAMPVAPLLAQPRPAAPAAKAKSGIDALDDDKIADDLANRGMDSLLQFYFEKNNIPQEKQQEKMVLIALRSLNEPTFNTLPFKDRKKKIDDIVAGIEKMLPQIKDPKTLLRYAAALIVNGTQRLVNTLEYWGENPRTQAALNPVAEAVDKILAQAADAAKADGDAILAKVVNPDDPRIKKWEEVETLRNNAVFTRAMAAYGLALSYDRAAVAKREKVCKQAITTLTDYLDPTSGVQVQAEVAIAKLNMVNGKYDEAHKHFAVVINLPEDAKPSQYISEQYQAHYFDLVTDVLAKKPEEAEKNLTALLKWQDERLPEAFKKGAEAATSMLEYRILSGKAELAQDKAAKDKANNAAVAILMDLVTKRPELRGIIFEQVMGKLPENPKMADLDPLLLEAIVTRGLQAVGHNPPEKEDGHNIDLASNAAREIVARKGKPGIGPEQVDSAAFRVGVLEERLAADPSMAAESQGNKLDAVEAYLIYVNKFAGNKTWATDALDNALALIFPIYRGNPGDDRASALYDKALDTALKAGRVEAAWPYALRLKDLQRFAKARIIFGKVRGNPYVDVMSKFYLMLCDQQLLSAGDKAAAVKSDDPEDAVPDATVLTAEIESLATKLNPLIDVNISKVDAKQQAAFRLARVRAMIIAADTARANKNPAKVVEVLKDFEQQATTLTPADQTKMLGIVLFLRVNALMALNRNDEAISAVEKLVEGQKPQESLLMISELLKKLNTSFGEEKDKKHPDANTLQLLAAQQAQLSELLLKQVQKDPANPNKADYLSFNAGAQMTAAKLATDPAKRNAFLDSASATYKALLSQTQEEGKANDLKRQLAIADFLRGDEKGLTSAHTTLNQLFADKKFGSAYERVEGSDESRPNELYWEGLSILLRSKVELAKLHNDPAMRADAERILKMMYIQFGDAMGGVQSKTSLQKLREEIIPNWKPTTEPTTAPSATTVPSSPGNGK